MTVPYTRAPHQGATAPHGADTLHAALLIDFDNVTMGMRSDLSKELKTLLDSDVIKGKVSVQRAYADWRRYPQYIVPLSEASVDLIFAPAYGSNKKNATDIRMAIDALELVFTRPEIGTYILLTGDSDFSSLVLKLKEYGKYVIGVGIQESSSDILVQNCDEYYSYTSLTGLTKTTELTGRGRDPWTLVKDAVTKMASRGDVMRSDRLKQVMQEIDSNFDEKGLGFSKFSKFLAEASSRDLVDLHKVGNGQYEVSPPKGGGRGAPRSTSGEKGRSRKDRGRGGRRERRETPARSSGAASPSYSSEDPLQEAYDLLREALERLRSAGREPVRDSDVKRKILEQRPNFDEAELGFSKFSKFLTQAADHGVIQIERRENGNMDVRLSDGTARKPQAQSTKAVPPAEATEPEPDSGEPDGPTVVEVLPPESGSSGPGLGLRLGSTRRRSDDEPVPLFEGQVAAPPGQDEDRDAPRTSKVDIAGLGLPSDPDAIVRYLAHRYRGVGEKTAEALVEHFGTGLFTTLQEDPDALTAVVPPNRAEQVLEAWRADYDRRTSNKDGGSGNGGRRGGRGRSRGRQSD